MHRLWTLSDTHGCPWPATPADVHATLFAGDLVDGVSEGEDAPAAVDPLALAWQRRTAGLPDTLEYANVLAVRGDHDVADPARFFADADDLSFSRLRRVGGRLWVGGIGWCGTRYFELPVEDDLRTRADLLRRAFRRQVMPGDQWVLLTHYPPALAPLPTDSHAGAYSATVAAVVRELKPLAVVAGHMHSWAGTVARMTYDGGHTTLIMPGPARPAWRWASQPTARSRRPHRAPSDRPESRRDATAKAVGSAAGSPLGNAAPATLAGHAERGITRRAGSARPETSTLCRGEER